MTGKIVFRQYSDFTQTRDICFHWKISCTISNDMTAFPWIYFLDETDLDIMWSWMLKKGMDVYCVRNYSL